MAAEAAGTPPVITRRQLDGDRLFIVNFWESRFHAQTVRGGAACCKMESIGGVRYDPYS